MRSRTARQMNASDGRPVCRRSENCRYRPVTAGQPANASDSNAALPGLGRTLPLESNGEQLSPNTTGHSGSAEIAWVTDGSRPEAGIHRIRMPSRYPSFAELPTRHFTRAENGALEQVQTAQWSLISALSFAPHGVAIEPSSLGPGQWIVYTAAAL